MDYCCGQLHLEKGFLTQVSKAITKKIRHHDPDEREQDRSYHWETVKSVLLKVRNEQEDFLMSIRIIRIQQRQQ